MIIKCSHPGSATPPPAILSRRTLLRLTGAGVGSVALAGVLAACEQAETVDSEGGTAGAGGNLSAAQVGAWMDLDPFRSPQIGTFVVADFWAAKLYRRDPFPPQTDLQPELASELPQEISPTAYSIKIRDDVFFQNGDAFTAHDVVFTLKFILAPENEIATRRHVDFIADAEAVNDFELHLTLAQPTSLLVDRLAMPLLPIVPRNLDPGTWGTAPIGAGPFQVTSTVPGSEVALTRYDGYVGPRDPQYDTVTIANVGDPTARIAGLRAERFKVIEDVPASAVEELSASGEINIEAVDSYKSVHMFFHCGKPPFDDVRVRQAACYAIDRDSIASTALFGMAVPTWQGWLPGHPDFIKPSVGACLLRWSA